MRTTRVAASTVLGLSMLLLPSAAPPARAVTFACGLTYNCATLTVSLYGEGSGEATSTYTKTATGTARIDCVETKGVVTGNCTQQFAWLPGYGTSESVTVTFTPAAGSVYCPTSSLSGCAGETDAGVGIIQLSVYGPALAHGFFRPASRRIQVTGTGTGSGKVKTEWTGVSATCAEPGTTCIYEAVYGQAVTLTATPDAGAVFSTWTGACAGQSSTCHVTLDTVYPDILTSTNAVFGLPRPSNPPTPVPTARPSAAPKASATPIGTVLPTASAAAASATAPAPTSDASDGAGMPGVSASGATPGPSLAPVSVSNDSGVPFGVVVVIAVLMLVIGALAVGLVFALRRRPG